MNDKEIILSVCIRSYNQERFIRDALDSVLMQKTDFPFEIIVSDDCSKDGARDILKEYQLRYLEKIRLLLHDSNLGGPNNLRAVIEASHAKYVCCLDGDDFFTDVYKLQKQVDFLEAHDEYAACFHNTWIVSETGRKCGIFNHPNFHEVHDAKEFITEYWFVPIHSAVIRREYIEFPDWYATVMNDDYVIHLSVARHGAYYFMPDVMVAYRKHAGEISTAYRNRVLVDTQLKTILENMKLLYPANYAPIFDTRIAQYAQSIAEETILSHPWKKWLHRKTYTRAIKRWMGKR